ncbi:hypothetical protein HAX54_011878, partial [Datura stramonium]|nr:hypothetical protein [Datura stramonium]
IILQDDGFPRVFEAIVQIPYDMQAKLEFLLIVKGLFLFLERFELAPPSAQASFNNNTIILYYEMCRLSSFLVLVVSALAETRSYESGGSARRHIPQPKEISYVRYVPLIWASLWYQGSG